MQSRLLLSQRLLQPIEGAAAVAGAAAARRAYCLASPQPCAVTDSSASSSTTSCEQQRLSQVLLDAALCCSLGYARRARGIGRRRVQTAPTRCRRSARRPRRSFDSGDSSSVHGRRCTAVRYGGQQTCSRVSGQRSQARRPTRRGGTRAFNGDAANPICSPSHCPHAHCACHCGHVWPM